jgi:hypothetical protein
MNKDTYFGVDRMFFEDNAGCATDNIYIRGINQLVKYQSLGDYQLMSKMTLNLLKYLFVTMRTELERNPDSNLCNVNDLEGLQVILFDYGRTEEHIRLSREQYERDDNEDKFNSSIWIQEAKEMEGSNGR